VPLFTSHPVLVGKWPFWHTKWHFLPNIGPFLAFSTPIFGKTSKNKSQPVQTYLDFLFLLKY
jgi:hypothetical protein